MQGLQDKQKAKTRSALLFYVLENGDVGVQPSIEVGDTSYEFNNTAIHDLAIIQAFLNYVIIEKIGAGAEGAEEKKND